MRKLVLYSLLSLDGVAENPDDYVLDWDDTIDDFLARTIATQDTVLLGRQTYDDWAPYWPTATHQPFADFINGVRKFAVTSTTPEVDWPGTTVVTEPVAAFVRDLKEQPGDDIGVHGSIRLAQSLLAENLVDEMRLVTTAVVAGKGRRLFDSAGPTRRWQLTDATASPSGALLTHYRLT